MKTLKKLKWAITPQEQHWVGDGFHVHTLIHPTKELYEYTSPFILLDYAPAQKFESSEKKKGVGEHPHRGFETVTFAYSGEVTHRDSAGGGGTIKEGDVQWMTAASGVVHEEFHSEDFTRNGGEFEMVQLWVNLRTQDKMSKPRYQGVSNKSFPRVKKGNSEIKVIAGHFENAQGACKTFTPINVYEVSLKDKINLDLDSDTNTVVLVRKGSIQMDGVEYKEKNLLVFEKEGNELELLSTSGAELLVLNAEPIDEPIVAHGPFVMNTEREIYEAIRDFQQGKMGRLEHGQ